MGGGFGRGQPACICPDMAAEERRFQRRRRRARRRGAWRRRSWGNGAARSRRPRTAAPAGPVAPAALALAPSWPCRPLVCRPLGAVVVVVEDVVDDDDGVPTPPGTGTVVTVVDVGIGDVVVVVLASGPVVVVVLASGPVVVAVGWPVGPVPSGGAGATGFAWSVGSTGRSTASPRPTRTSSIQVRPGR